MQEWARAAEDFNSLTWAVVSWGVIKCFAPYFQNKLFNSSVAKQQVPGSAAVQCLSSIFSSSRITLLSENLGINSLFFSPLLSLITSPIWDLEKQWSLKTVIKVHYQCSVLFEAGCGYCCYLGCTEGGGLPLCGRQSLRATGGAHGHGFGETLPSDWWSSTQPAHGAGPPRTSLGRCQNGTVGMGSVSGKSLRERCWYELVSNCFVFVFFFPLKASCWIPQQRGTHLLHCGWRSL